jgi:hypothetical protein
LLLLLSLFLAACASYSHQATQPLGENQVPLLEASAIDPAPEPADNRDPLQVCAVVPDEELQEMRGGYGIYYFTYVMDLNLADDQPSAKVDYAAVVPEGSPAPSLNGATAYYADNNVFFSAGPQNGSGLGSTVIVAGTGVTVNTVTQFNFHMPDASNLIPSISVMPQMSGTSF